MSMDSNHSILSNLILKMLIRLYHDDYEDDDDEAFCGVGPITLPSCLRVNTAHEYVILSYYHFYLIAPIL